MKLLLTICFLFSFNLSFSQNIDRGEFALFLFNDIYPNGSNPTDFQAGYFPTSYLDEGQAGPYEDFIRILSFLEFGDGVPVFDRVGTAFNSDDEVSRVEAIKMVIEAYNIPLNTSGSLPYNDYNNPNDPYYQQVLTAYNYGIIAGGSTLNPYPSATVNYVSALMNSADNINTPSLLQLYDIDNYFKPFNISLETMGQFQGVQQGGFSHYAKSSFVIPDIKFSLDFSHFYTNMMVEIPPEFYPIKPIGRGWSHTFNSYIVFHNNPGSSNDDLYTIVWPDGTIHVFNEDDNEYETRGVYDDLNEIGNNVIEITKKDGTEYRYTRLDSGRPIYYLERIRDRNGNSIEVEYQTAEEIDTKRIEWVEAPSGKRLFFEYQNGTDLIEKITDPIGREIFFEYSGITAGWVYQYPVLVAFQDAKYQITDYSYGLNNPYDIHLLNRIELPEGNEILAEYSGDGKLSEYQMNNDDPTQIDVNFNYSNQNYLSTVEVPTEGGNMNVQDYTFNEYGKVTEYIDNNNSLQINYPPGGINVMLPSNSNMNGVEIDYSYDAQGNATIIDKENGMSIEYFDWNPDNTLDNYTDANGSTTYFYYDNNGNLIQITDALGSASFFAYDNFGQLVTSTNQEGIQTVYSYENDGVVSAINQPENINYSFSYDGINRLLQRNDNGLITDYLYDDNDNLTSQTNSGGFTTTFNYDMNDNMVGILNANNVSTLFEYDQQDRVIKETFGSLVKEYEYGNEGFLEQYTKPSGIQINYEYDNDGRLKETSTISNIEYSSRNLIQEITTNAGTTYLDYDNLNRLDEVVTVHGTQITYLYDDVGNVLRIFYPTVNGNNLFVRYYYDEKNRMERVSVNINGQYTTLAYYLYRDDDLLSNVEYPTNGLYTKYDYDNAGRKTGIKYNFVSGINAWDTLFYHSVSLDNRGNILQENRQYLGTDPNTSYLKPVANYSYDNNNHIEQAGTTTFNINDDGNTTYNGGNVNETFVFNDDDNLIEMNVGGSTSCFPFTYEYNGFGQQVSETSSTGPFGEPPIRMEYSWDLVNNNMIFSMVEGQPQTSQYIIYGATGLEFIIDDLNNPVFMCAVGDLRGSVISQVYSDNQSFFNFKKYDDFGKEMGIGGSNTGCDFQTEYAYLGKHGVRKSKNGLYYVKARYYDPEIGRFLSEDPVWSTNLYPYADNNPISKIDPSGESAIALGIVASMYYLFETGAFDVGYAIYANKSGNYTQSELNAIHAGVVASTIAPGGGYGIVAGISNRINFSTRVAIHMKNPARRVPIQIIEYVINNTRGYADSQGSRALKYFTRITRNGKTYNFEVLYDERTNTIWHFKFGRKAMGPLSKIPK